MNGYKTSQQTTRHRGISLVSALFVFVMVFLFLLPVRAESRTSSSETSVSSNPDTNIVKYDLNDPRNPDCPCHKPQQQAEDEYKKQQGANIAQNPVNNQVVNNDNHNQQHGDPNDVNANKPTFTSSSGGSQKHYSSFYKFQRKMIHWGQKVNWKLKKKHNGIKHGKIHIADCFHFD